MIILAPIVFLIFGVQAFAAIFTHRDAARRNMNSMVWALVVLIGPLFLGFIVYMICREPISEYQCPKCGAAIKYDSNKCPSCYALLRTTCDKCGFPVKTGWNSCPNCGNVMPDDFIQPVKVYKKNRDIPFYILIAVGFVMIIVVTIVLPMIMSINRNIYSENRGYCEFAGEVNISADDFSDNEYVQEWIQRCDNGNKEAYVLFSKKSNICLVYAKNTTKLLTSSLDADYSGNEDDMLESKCNVTINIDETEYDDSFGYKFVAYRIVVTNNMKVQVAIDGNSVSTDVQVTDAEISLD